MSGRCVSTIQTRITAPFRNNSRMGRHPGLHMVKRGGEPQSKATKLGKERSATPYAGTGWPHFPQYPGCGNCSVRKICAQNGQYAVEYKRQIPLKGWRMGPSPPRSERGGGGGDVPHDHHPPSLRMNVETPATSPIAAELTIPWNVAADRLTRTVFEWAWEVGLYSIPAGSGVLTSTHWGRRDVRFPHVFFTAQCVRWTWIIGTQIALAEFANKVHRDAKLVTTSPSQSVQFDQLWGPVLCYLLCASVSIYGYWEMPRWISGYPCLPSLGQTEIPPTGTTTNVAPETNASQTSSVPGVEEDPPPATLLGGMQTEGDASAPHSGVEGSPIPSGSAMEGRSLSSSEPQMEDKRRMRDAPRTFLTGRPKQLLAGLSCHEEDLDRYCLMEDDARATDNADNSAFCAHVVGRSI